MEKLSTQKRAAVLQCLIEGMSIRAASRITGAAKGTITKLLEQAGEACADFQSENLRNLPCKVIQLDEVWSFVGCRDANKEESIGTHPGDVWTWTSICAETKLIPAWRVGDRSARTAMDFCNDLSGRFSGNIQISSDGHTAYKIAIGHAFETVHYGQLVKIYGKDGEGKDVVIRADKVPVFGNPDIDLISTSYVERSNLTLRMGNRRFTRLTNAFSKKLENHVHALALGFMHYNFCRKHGSIKTTPAIAAGVTNHQWTLEEVIEMIDAYLEAKMEGQYEEAFATLNFTAPRKFPKSYKPVAPKVPWYLDPNSGGPLGAF